MWIMHPDFGFLSIVTKPHLPEHMLCVRSRSRAHLEAFQAFAKVHKRNTGPITENEGTDYAFRCVARREVVVKVMTEAIEGIDYTNFKNESKRQGQSKGWLTALARIWQAHFSFQNGAA